MMKSLTKLLGNVNSTRVQIFVRVSACAYNWLLFFRGTFLYFDKLSILGLAPYVSVESKLL